MIDLPPLNALRAFEAVGRTGSMTAAAAELCVTPAAISQHVRTLERHVGQPLLHREHRGVRLSDAGQRFHEAVALGFAGIRRATSDLMSRPERTTFSIRAPHSVAMRWLLPRMARFHQQHPSVDLKLSTSVAIPDFAKEDLDAGICLGHGRWRGVEVLRVMPSEVTPVCSPDRARRLRRPEQLLGETLLHTLARPDDWRHWLRAAGIRASDLSRGMRYETSALAIEAALEGFGIAMAQPPMVERELAEGRLVAPFDLRADLGGFTYYLVLPPPTYKRSSRALTAFRDWTRSLAVGGALAATRRGSIGRGGPNG